MNVLDNGALRLFQAFTATSPLPQSAASDPTPDVPYSVS